jgi:invasion protein IalB
MASDHTFFLGESPLFLSAMLAATVLMADTTPAAAASTTAKTAEAPAPAAKKTEKPKLICKTESVTGSMMPKKTCYSSDDLAQRQQEERQNLERIQTLSNH